MGKFDLQQNQFRLHPLVTRNKYVLFWYKKTILYTAIEDENGKLLTSEDDIDNETVKHYSKVLENRKISPNLEEYQKDREELCEIRIKEAKRNITPNWTAENVKRVVKELKKKKTHMDIQMKLSKKEAKTYKKQSWN